MRAIYLILLTTACSEYAIDTKPENNLGADSGENNLEDTEAQDPLDPYAPVAICSVSPNTVTPPFQAATFDGSMSYDPSGDPIASYSWELISQPAGSSATLPFSSANQIPNFYADLAGAYTAELTVINQIGLADSCQVTLESLPTQNLWVEMFWDEIDDMDLHLLAPGGSYGDWDSDCYYLNCVDSQPDWGVLNDNSDDPSLDLDDINGLGPENINIDSPQSSGTYTVVIHDYQGSAPIDFQGPNMVTVNVYLNGSMAWTGTKAISGEDSITPFCSINWGTLTVTPL